MKLFDFGRAPNPQRVRIFLAEKGIEIQKIPVNLYRMEQLSPEFLAINPGGTVPVLETDDGVYLSECLAICHYLEDLHPEPPLFGTGPTEKAQVLMWNNIVENEGLPAIAEMLRNWSPGFRDHVFPGPTRIEQIPALIERGRALCTQFFDRVEGRLADRRFLAGQNFSFADITLFTVCEFAGWVEIRPTEGRPALEDWYGKIASRSSAQA